MNRYEKIVLRIAANFHSSGFSGRGRLVEYNSKKDSWILNQMKKDKVDPGIQMTNKGRNNIKFKTNGGEYQ